MWQLQNIVSRPRQHYLFLSFFLALFIHSNLMACKWSQIFQAFISDCIIITRSDALISYTCETIFYVWKMYFPSSTRIKLNFTRVWNVRIERERHLKHPRRFPICRASTLNRYICSCQSDYCSNAWLCEIAEDLCRVPYGLLQFVSDSSVNRCLQSNFDLCGWNFRTL